MSALCPHCGGRVHEKQMRAWAEWWCERCKVRVWPIFRGGFAREGTDG